MLDTRVHPPVMIVGGGLSGLAAAAILARAGYAVTVFEKASVPGGDARSKQQGAFTHGVRNEVAHGVKRLLDDGCLPQEKRR